MVEGGELAGQHGGAIASGIGSGQDDHPLPVDRAEPAGGVDILVAHTDLELPGYGLEFHQECRVIHAYVGTSPAGVS